MNAGYRGGTDVGDKVVDLIQAPFGGVEIPASDIDDVINQSGKVLVDLRMSNKAHQVAVPPPAW